MKKHTITITDVYSQSASTVWQSPGLSFVKPPPLSFCPLLELSVTAALDEEKRRRWL
eukprot:c43254_g1_i1 orf=25-195(+)